MITRRSLFGFALVPLAKPVVAGEVSGVCFNEIAYAEAYGAALGARTAAQMAPRIAALMRLRDAAAARESIMAMQVLDVDFGLTEAELRGIEYPTRAIRARGSNAGA